MIERPSGDRHWTRRKPELIKRGADSHAAKLSAAAIDRMRQEFERGANQTWLARKYGVSRYTVWRHLRKSES